MQFVSGSGLRVFRRGGSATRPPSGGKIPWAPRPFLPAHQIMIYNRPQNGSRGRKRFVTGHEFTRAVTTSRRSGFSPCCIRNPATRRENP